MIELWNEVYRETTAGNLFGAIAIIAIAVKCYGEGMGKTYCLSILIVSIILSLWVDGVGTIGGFLVLLVIPVVPILSGLAAVFLFSPIWIPVYLYNKHKKSQGSASDS